ncbi:MAG: CoA transferase [Gammaproteobacteria bacterium]|nr:CoA transferase [Gammaproteobacteria bacterium]
MDRPFSGLRVLDMSTRLSGAFAARLFGDYGADVVLAETVDGHPLRQEPPFLDGQAGLERSVLHAYANWNKRSVTVKSREELATLVRRADLLITTVELDDALAALLAQRANRAVHLSITAHGLSGPLAALPGNNLTMSARTGWAHINGQLNEPPLQMPGRQSGYVGGLAGFIAAAAALRRCGHDMSRSERVDVSELEAFAVTVHPWGIRAIYEGTGETCGPSGGRPRGAPDPLWETIDGAIHLGFRDWHNWPSAMHELNLPQYAEQSDLVPDLGRHSKDLSAVIAAAAQSVARLERWPLFHKLADLRCISGVLQDVGDLVQDPQLNARNFVVRTRIEDREVRAAGAPAQSSTAPWQLAQPAPRLGEHGGDGALARLWATPHGPDHFGDLSPDRAAGPLSGVRVLSFGQAWSGTFGTELLAFLGADVVQVEALHRPDVWRRTRAEVPMGVKDEARVQHALNTSGLYNSVNLNKRAITLDVTTERGMALFWGLLPRFDVLAENFRPTVMPKWGVTLETLHEKRPGIVFASISAYGTRGPYHSYPGNGSTIEPMSGISSLHGYRGDSGMNTGGLYPDPVAGYFFAAAIMAALAQRDRTGESQRVDLAMNEALAVMCGDALVEFDATGCIPRPHGNSHLTIAPHNMYPTKGGAWIAIAAESDNAWRALVAFAKQPAWEADARFQTMASRKEHETVLDKLLSAWTVTQDAQHLESGLAGVGVTAASVTPLYDLHDRANASFVASGFVQAVDHSEVGSTWLPGRPWRLSGGTSEPLRPAPCLGEHSREILVGELGVTAQEYDELVRDGITGTLYDGPV